MSITEMEAQYGVLRKTEGGGRTAELENARFYFRRQGERRERTPDDDDDGDRLAAYQERIRASGASVKQFDDPIALGTLIYDDLVSIIKRDFADARPPTPLEQERARHEAFSLSRRRAYIANPAYLKRLNDHAASDDAPLVVYAESGSGKSSLFAFWAEQYRRRHPGAHVIEHYVGIGATATDHYAVISHICNEINERFRRDEEIPSDPGRLETALGQWLGYADLALQMSGEKLVVILDGLNQLQGAALNLRWIPDVISPSIRLILSSTVEGTLVELEKRGWGRYGMQALTEAERETIIVRYLAEYRKSLNPQQINRIASDYKCGHPLFLKTLVEELRLVGRHEDLDAMITTYLDSTGTEDLFQRVLERLESDHTPAAVRDVMTLVSASRSGLDERELSEITGIARLRIATMVAGMDYHLVHKAGRLTFFHDYLRRAVDKRYLSDETKLRSTHHRIAEYFDNGVAAAIAAGEHVTTRVANELCYQLRSAGEMERLYQCLANIPVFMAVYTRELQSDVMRYWSSAPEGTDVAAMYRRGLDEWSVDDPEVWSYATALLAHLLEQLGDWTGATNLQQERLASAVRHNRKSTEADARRGMGWLLMMRGAIDEAMQEFSTAFDLFTELGDRRRASYALGNKGLVYFHRGEFDRAIECLDQTLSLAEETGVAIDGAKALGNLGLVYCRLGDYDRAIECYERELSISARIGDRSTAAGGYSNLGTVYSQIGNNDRAIECLQQALKIGEELGDRGSIEGACGNLGVVYARLGEYSRALECFERQLNIAEDLGDQEGISSAIGNMGDVYLGMGDVDRALACQKRRLSIAEQTGNRHGVSRAIGSMGSVYVWLGEMDPALECYERQLGLDEELNDRAGAAVAIGNIGMVHARLGAYERALDYCHRAAAEHRAIGFKFGLTYWLHCIGDVIVMLVQDGEPPGGAGNEEDPGAQNGDATRMPEYLPKYYPDMTRDSWRSTSLEIARTCAEECIETSEQLSKPDTLFLGRILLGRVEVATGNLDGAKTRFRAMLEAADNDDHRAELHYWLWTLGEAEHAPQALALFQALYATAPRHAHHRRIVELQGQQHAPDRSL